jgi:hypothetical protein
VVRRAAAFAAVLARLLIAARRAMSGCSRRRSSEARGQPEISSGSRYLWLPQSTDCMRVKGAPSSPRVQTARATSAGNATGMHARSAMSWYSARCGPDHRLSPGRVIRASRRSGERGHVPALARMSGETAAGAIGQVSRRHAGYRLGCCWHPAYPVASPWFCCVYSDRGALNGRMIVTRDVVCDRNKGGHNEP